ncbi:hypothetical protein PPERSA_01613 [Pseudocohnilembus persalinus]|uniref:Transmembrane protein n=1 Tax=Pseudocohnilembus persalinus TaxID=266149 RepID=A0A0V0QHM5_PSEPJ|nr:hypothetical protein PPERSA_01613 [Pseudocohnilembus persalinus]|eukprot:KRX01743.1 hypothetical protein PPERSA_01613 [Pseudocohnilembus persalinus]
MNKFTIFVLLSLFFIQTICDENTYIKHDTHALSQQNKYEQDQKQANQSSINLNDENKDHFSQKSFTNDLPIKRISSTLKQYNEYKSKLEIDSKFEVYHNQEEFDSTDNWRQANEMIQKAKDQCTEEINICNKDKICYVMNFEYFECLDQNYYPVGQAYVSLSCTQIAGSYVKFNQQQNWKDLKNCYNSVFGSEYWERYYQLKCLAVLCLLAFICIFFINIDTRQAMKIKIVQDDNLQINGLEQQQTFQNLKKRNVLNIIKSPGSDICQDVDCISQAESQQPQNLQKNNSYLLNLSSRNNSTNQKKDIIINSHQNPVHLKIHQ